MKKLILGVALTGLSMPLIADDAINLASGSQLDVQSVSQVRLQDGETQDNVWFSLDPTQFSDAADKQLSNCVLTAQVALDSGELFFTSRSLRCPSRTGDVYTAENVSAKLITSTNQLCTASGSYCTEVTLDTSAAYRVELEAAAKMEAAYNASREVNRIRIDQQRAD
ncbi:hypothetical protein SAMN05660443_0274 [Marinospirillum celere]|uniref:Uncharacterized protein n=1 Tax=Marinospirillum celere TaxID=1122252 RepID=A0A1I1E822_9GAMM|nr:hypothetical protein [Marinospirillum celere]SFB81130.1 hypothetical protein SAMN05660443_0274 [Marinospirillum celere]